MRALLHNISFTILRLSGTFPLVLVNNKPKASTFWKNWSAAITLLLLASILARIYIYWRNGGGYNSSAGYIFQLIGEIEPYYSIVFVLSIGWTNVFTRNVKQQECLIRTLTKFHNLSTESGRLSLLPYFLPIFLVYVLIIGRYFIVLENVDGLEKQELLYCLALSSFTAFQRTKICLQMVYFRRSLKHIRETLHRDFDFGVTQYEHISRSLELFEGLYRPVHQSLLLDAFFNQLSWLRGLQGVITTYLSIGEIYIDTLIITFWYANELPVFIWMMHLGERIKREVWRSSSLL